VNDSSLSDNFHTRSHAKPEGRRWATTIKEGTQDNMADAPKAARGSQAANQAIATTANPIANPIAGRIAELKVSANLMTLDVGLFCLLQQPGAAAAPKDGSGLPGVRISVPPHATGDGAAARAQGEITIRGLHADGWLGPQDGAALVRVSGRPAQILITVYQSPNHPAEAAPRLQVVPLATEQQQAEPAAKAPARASAAKPSSAAVKSADIIAHVQHQGDVGVALGEWMGKPGSKSWVEGFAVTPVSGLSADEFEYQAVLGRGWMSPWVSGGKFCGSRGMALPLLGFNLRLRGKAADKFDCTYSASFTDGTRVGPLRAGQACEAQSLAPLEAFQIMLSPRGSAAAGTTRAKAPTAKAPEKTTPAKKASTQKAAAKKAPARKRSR